MRFPIVQAAQPAMKEAAKAAERAIGAAASLAEVAAGGPARLKVALLLAAVLGLDAADKASLSAIAGALKDAFHINNTDIGLLVAATSLAGAIFTLPIGILVDRIERRRILIVAIAIWTLAMAASGAAWSFPSMIVIRAFLGAVTAAAAPTVASLVGDFFAPRVRAQLYGAILSGELVGIGFGFVLSGEISSLADWRWSLWIMAIPGAIIAWVIWRFLPEPARGGQSWIQFGQEEVRSREDLAQEGTPAKNAGDSGAELPEQAAQTHRKVQEAHIEPRRELVLHDDPTRWSLWRTVRYVLRIPTFRLLVIASGLGYYFFAGIRAFGMIYLTQHYGLSRSVVSALAIVVGLGGLAGLAAGGQLSSWLLGRGWITARVIVGGGALLLAALFAAPAIWTTSPIIGIALLTVATAALAAANPPIDAARLDIMHPRLWGRAESARMALRGFLEGLAPIIFGWLSVVLAPGNTGLEWTFLIMLIPVLVASSLAIPAMRTYPRDVATADASVRAVSPQQSGRDR